MLMLFAIFGGVDAVKGLFTGTPTSSVSDGDGNGPSGQSPSGHPGGASSGNDRSGNDRSGNDQSGNDQAENDGQQSAANPLELVESGWSANATGYVHYAVAVRNTGGTQIIYPTVAVTGRAKDGSVVFAEEQVMNVAFPGQTLWYGGQAGNGTAPDTVEFAMRAPESYAVTNGKGTATFTVSNTAVKPDGMGGKAFTGEVGVITDGYRPQDFMQVQVSLVLRDKSGAIVYGDGTFVDWSADGATTAFSIMPYDIPDYASYELHAQQW